MGCTRVSSCPPRGCQLHRSSLPRLVPPPSPLPSSGSGARPSTSLQLIVPAGMFSSCLSQPALQFQLAVYSSLELRDHAHKYSQLELHLPLLPREPPLKSASLILMNPLPSPSIPSLSSVLPFLPLIPLIYSSLLYFDFSLINMYYIQAHLCYLL